MADTVVHLVTMRGESIKKLAAAAVAVFFLLSVTVCGVLATPGGDRVHKILQRGNLHEQRSVPSCDVRASSKSNLDGNTIDGAISRLVKEVCSEINESREASKTHFSRKR